MTASGQKLVIKNLLQLTAAYTYLSARVNIVLTHPRAPWVKKISANMTLTLIRHNYSENYTEGELFLGEKKLCDTLEDKERVIRNKADKVAGYTAIPKGTYAIAWTYSPRFHRYTPEILQVPWFTAIRIHAGNTPEDTAGCILVGRKGEAKGTLVTSRITAEKIYTLISSRILKGEKVQLIIC